MALEVFSNHIPDGLNHLWCPEILHLTSKERESVFLVRHGHHTHPCLQKPSLKCFNMHSKGVLELVILLPLLYVFSNQQN